MSLLTPDFGLLVWMTLIFVIVLVLLGKFGFPVITGMVEKRSNQIEESLRKAAEAESRLSQLADEQSRLVEQTRAEQSRLVKEAAEVRDKMIQSARQKASEEAAKIIAHAKTEIQAERESALRDLCRQVSMLSIDVAEKIIRKDLDKGENQFELVDRLVRQASQMREKQS